MLGLHARALAVDLGPWIGRVELDVLDEAAGRDAGASLAALFEPHQDLVLDLHVPRIVVFAGLNDRAGGRYGVAAALHLDRVEVRPIRDMIGGIALALDEIARLEVDEPVRT